MRTCAQKVSLVKKSVNDMPRKGVKLEIANRLSPARGNYQSVGGVISSATCLGKKLDVLLHVYTQIYMRFINAQNCATCICKHHVLSITV